MLVDQLFASLSQRWTPEQVVEAILTFRVDVYTSAERLQLKKALPRWKSSMPDEFAQANDLRKQLATAATLFKIPAPAAVTDPAQVVNYLDTLKASIHFTGTDFKGDRWNRAGRKEAGLRQKGHRAYNKRFRLLQRMDAKFGRWLLVSNMRDLAQIAKSRLATRIEKLDFQRDVDTACFIAYLTARLNVRSTFTFGKQDRPYDTIADLLFQRLNSQFAGWFAIAHVYPTVEVLGHLTEEEKGRLLGTWYHIMVRTSTVLKTQVAKDKPDLVQLIVARGNDSSTWNEAAGAFTKAREGWINTLHALHGEELLDEFVPGKALRLMAADVAWGHRAMGDGLEPDTAVWNELPKPWEVVLSGAICTRDMILAACKKYGIEGKGWIAPRPKTVVEFKPTPELVHGVVISSPALAATLKALGYFGGPTKAHKVKGSVPIKKELDGLTVKVSEAEDDEVAEDSR